MNVSTDRFTYTKEDFTFGTFHSDIQDVYGSIKRIITLVNPKTNGEMTFEMTREVTREGDIESWRYRSISDPKIKLVIFND